ncbi:TRAP transporter substrate-binding protein [Salipiger abyssi]|uniref:TRAP-type C4-dicarboxylate transport system, periplasmic component n=1 Tax=Salipiger abyssi TaxID=1250539 RepID=A0A1P8UMT2_9RHOB|nr:TRAP transporter substrate-binding protein [Salipiger abyssi]APZ50716.1 TRAP-type C4-dicarboxylate transport system, periplasmic component [Salipiger abyssi]
MLKTLTTPLLAGVLAAAALPAWAQSVTWDLANEYPPNSVHAQSADTFIEALQEVSGGDMVVTAHHGAALGYKSIDQYDAVGDGALDLASSFATPWSGIDPVFILSSIPFLVTTPEEERQLYEIAKPYYEAVLADDNQVLLFATPWPPSGLWGNKPLDSMEALDGVKLRTYDANGTITFGNTAATPVQLSWADTVPQLSTGAIDAVLTSADGGSASQLWEQQSHFTEVNYAMPLQFVHVNRDVYDALTDEQKAWVTEAAAAAEDFGWGLLEDRVAQNYAEMESHGMTVVTGVDPAYIAALTEAAEPALEEWKEKMGDDADSILAAFEEMRAE